MSDISKNLYKILTDEKVDKFVMALNAPWGYGKTHIAHQLIKQMGGGGSTPVVIPIFIDLSDYDYVNDPLIPFIVEILHSINLNELIPSEKKQELIKTIKNVALHSAKVLATFEPSGIASKIIDTLLDAKKAIDDEKNTNTDTLLLEFESYTKLIDDLSQTIENLRDVELHHKNGTESNIRRVVVFVDNFDRVECRFTFKFLNLIDKISATNISFCLLMNKEQLEKNIYNNLLSQPANSNEHFLNKYVDFEYCLPHLNDRIDEILPCFDNPVTEKHIRSNIELLAGVSVRQIIEIEKLYFASKDKLVNETYYYKGDKGLIFKLACFIITTKDALIQLYYNFTPSIRVLCESVSAKFLINISNVATENKNVSRAANQDPTTYQPYYTINKIMFNPSTELNEIYNHMMKVLLKEI